MGDAAGVPERARDVVAGLEARVAGVEAISRRVEQRPRVVLLEWLDAPVKRVASLDTWVAYAPQLEDAILPQTEDVVNAIDEIMKY